MENVIAILEDLKPGVDYATHQSLVDERVLDSLTIVALVAELEDAYDVAIPAVEIVADNFNSAENIRTLMVRLVEDERG